MSPRRARGAARGRAGQAAILVLLSLVLYWPAGTWFQSDDFVAVTYARDPARVAADLAGAQYGLRSVALFWRPLITASFGLESWLFGADPWGYHLDNCLVHGLNTLLVLLILARILGWNWACRATFLWALHPAHAGSVLWAVGRVDVHATFWILLSLALHQRWQRGRGGRAAALVALGLALATKELALCQPLLVASLSICGQINKRSRSLRALQETWPFLVVVGAWSLWRLFLFGEFKGGYGAATSGLESLWRHGPLWAGRLLAPLASPLGARAFLFDDPFLPALGIVAGWLALLLLGRERSRILRAPAGLGFGALWFLAASVPLYAFFQYTENLKTLRLFYLPLIGLMTVAGAGGWRPTLLIALVLIPVHFPVRSDFRDAMAWGRRAHTGLLAEAPTLDPEQPLFVAGLIPEIGVAHVMHLGTDRLLLPPFAAGRPRIFPWKPMSAGSAHLQWTPEAFGYPLPQFCDAGGEAGVLRRTIPGTACDLFDLEADQPPRLGFEELYPLGLDPAMEGSGDLFLRPNPPHPGPYRVMILTGHGYTACFIESEPCGALSLRKLFSASSTWDGRSDFVAFQLAVALDIDLVPEFLVLVQRLDRPGRQGRPVARARRPLPLRFAPSALEFFLPSLRGR